MHVGQMTQTVEVTTEAPTVELTSSALSAQVNAATVRELPLIQQCKRDGRAADFNDNDVARIAVRPEVHLVI
jgi:hypothetical protein